ncbi:MAG: HIT family protein [Phycisphaerales bacterium]|nr:HIT family protein [Phycisphaerales bacterium]MCB9854827.1 HIT family protein [Phycisphaerales bacterium]
MADHSDCIFCKIASGKIPSARVWSSDDAVAFLDVSPLAEGHTLLIPRRHFTDLRDVPADVLARILSVAPKLVGALMNATGATGVNVLQNTGASAGQAVFHLHFHFIPRVEGDGLGFRWNAGSYPSGRADEVLAAVTAAMV